MDKLLPVLIGVLAAGFFTTIGWFVTDRLSWRRSKKSLRTETLLQHTKRQVDELYGPLLGLIEYSDTVFGVVKRLLSKPIQDSRKDFPPDLNDRDMEIWRFFVESYFIPTHRAIRELLYSHYHLLEHGDLPRGGQMFLLYAADLESRHTLWKQRQIDTEQVEGTEYPIEFKSDVKVILKELRERQQQYLEMPMGLPYIGLHRTRQEVARR